MEMTMVIPKFQVEEILMGWLRENHNIGKVPHRHKAETTLSWQDDGSIIVKIVITPKSPESGMISISWEEDS